jgi:hypothetical protein
LPLGESSGGLAAQHSLDPVRAQMMKRTILSVFAACVVVGIAMTPQARGEDANGVIYTDTQSDQPLQRGRPQDGEPAK